MNDNLLDDKLLHNAKKGNMEAFEIIIKQYEKLYFNIAYRLLSNYDDAKDATQDSLIKIYKNIDKCLDMKSFKSWSSKIVTNTSIDLIRSKKRRLAESLDEKLSGDENNFDKQINSNEPTPEDVFIKEETKKIILECINELDEKFKTVIILRDINGFSYDEIKEITDSSLGTVKSRISRARTMLKEMLNKKLELKR